MKLAFAAFRGEMPILDPRLLPEMNAQAARNLYLRHGTLKPERSPGASVGMPSIINPSALYRYPNGNDGQGFWLVWGSGKRVDVVKSPLADDDFKRVYWTGDGPPKMGGIADITQGSGPYPGMSYRLGLPAPDAPPVATAPPGRVDIDDQPLTAVRTSYVVTMVSRYGEEGPPSLPSNSIMRWDMVEEAPAGGDVVISLPGIPSGAFDIVSKRIYRAELSGVFQFVAAVPAAQGSYTDSVLSENLGVQVPSLGWDMPDDRMIGLTEMPGGFLAGYFENTLCFSEAFRPHAWPVEYQLAFSDDIMGVAAVAGGLVVATAGKPHMITGSTPAAMADTPLDSDQPCLSGRSLVDMGQYAIYASPNGLVAVGGGEAQVVTQGMISKEQWQALEPASIHAYRHEGRYLAFYSGGCFAFTPGEGFEFFDIAAQAGYYDLTRDSLYLIQGQAVAEWGAGPLMQMRWRSKISEQIPGTTFSCAKVIAYGYPVTLRIYADGALVFAEDVVSPAMFRLPTADCNTRDWEVEVLGLNEVSSVQLASSPNELI